MKGFEHTKKMNRENSHFHHLNPAINIYICVLTYPPIYQLILYSILFLMPAKVNFDACQSGFPDSKESASNAGNLGLIPGLRRSLEKGMATHSSMLA